MTSAQRMALRLSAVLLLLASAMLVTAWRQDSRESDADAAAAAPAAVATFYGADTTWTNNAIKAIWPQRSGPYCGIAAALALVNYDDASRGLALRFTSASAQSTVAAQNQTAGASQWGYPTPKSPTGGMTNISRDTGTDPRSIAYMVWNYTPNNTYYHDYVHRWQFANSSKPSYSTQVLQATTSMARALETWREPLIAQINGGLHSVLVTGVYSYNDPARNYPAQITSVVYRDPMAGPTVSRFQVSIGTWTSGHFSTPYGIYSLWSLYYGDRYAIGDRANPADPEPAVGVYKPTASNPIHWNLGFTWIQRDNNYANGAWNPDWAYTSSGARLTAP
jgi:hypothetical protein